MIDYKNQTTFGDAEEQESMFEAVVTLFAFIAAFCGACALFTVM